MKNKIWLWSVLLAFVLLAAGCSTIDNPVPITSESTGFWSKYIVYPLSWLITTTAEAMGNSYGLGIVIVTILIRLAILPLMIKQTQNAKAMQVIQPEMQKLREKYSSKDAQTQQKMQQEMMQLFQKHNVNPLAGCFPLLVQMPILIGFYQAIIRTEAISAGNFLWFELGSPDPLFILPIVAAGTTFLQQKMMMANGGAANPQMQMMLYIMPIMILIFAINFPAALSLYWVVGNIFMIVQTYFVKPPVIQTDGRGDQATKKGKVRGAKK